MNLNHWAHANIRIPLPPAKAEQEAIAEALSDADALIESLEQLIAKKRQIKQGTMQALLTGKQRLPGFKGNWQTRRSEILLSIMHGKICQQLWRRRRDLPYSGRTWGNRFRQ